MIDQPEGSEEIVEEALGQRKPADKAQESEWFKLSREATKTGQQCPVCGWQDGDGIKACFYSSRLGAVTHENTIEGAKQTMTPAQASLVDLRMKLLYTNAESREKYLEGTWQKSKAAEEEHKRLKRPYPFIVTDGKEMTTEERHRQYVEKQMAEPLATDYPYRAWVQKKQGEYMVFCYEPHPNCGGVQEGVGPYHLRCSKCGVEVRLWEHGIDYDVG